MVFLVIEDGSNSDSDRGDAAAHDCGDDGYNGDGVAYIMVTEGMVGTVLVVIMMRVEVIVSVSH